MTTKICVCGGVASTCRTYFAFKGDNIPIEREIVWMCDECFEEHNLYCEDHGPCDFTDSPEILAIYGCENEDGIFIGICSQCIKNYFDRLDDKTISELKNVYLSSEYFKASEYLLKLGENYLNEEFFKKNSLIKALVFYGYISRHELGVETVVADISAFDSLLTISENN